jgi:Cytochrome c554 and c-prime
MFRRVGLLAALGAAACCSKSEVKSTGKAPPDDPAPARPTFTVFATAEVRGQIGPCGCTSDPLGDISRTVQLVAQARAAGPVLFVDAGSLLYSRVPIPPHLEAQEELKANLLAETYQQALKVDALGLGPADLPRGPKAFDHLRLPRLVSNIPELPAAAPRLIEIGGAKAGVFGVIAEGAVVGLPLADPVAAGKQAVARLRGQGAQVVIGLVQAGSKRDAAKLVREIGGIDLAVAGLGLVAPEPEEIAIEPQPIGDGWLIIPANRGQILARLDVTLRGPGPLADAIGPGAAAARIAVLDKRLAALDADLAAFAADRTADQAFVAQKQQERTTLAADRDRLKAHPLAVPPHGSYLTLEQIRIGKALACNVAVQDAVSKFYRATGEVNVKAAASVAVEPPPNGQAAYTGMEACADCHAEASAFWSKTRHAAAWKTLEDRGQQFDFDCIGCHVTGWDKPGGSNLGHNSTLRNVQCETCHGPGSIHVAKGGLDKPATIKRAPANDLCASQCHTKEHSDTFQLEPYLRDVLGPGHGEARRKQLGEGPTGAQLRKAAIDKAGRTIGAGCTR